MRKGSFFPSNFVLSKFRKNTIQKNDSFLLKQISKERLTNFERTLFGQTACSVYLHRLIIRMDENLWSKLSNDSFPIKQRFLISTFKSGETDQIFQLECGVELPFNLATLFWLYQALQILILKPASSSSQTLSLNLSLSQKDGQNCLKNYPLIIIQFILMRFQSQMISLIAIDQQQC